MNSRLYPRHLVLPCLVLLVTLTASAHAAMQRGLRFSSPGVLDLAERTQQLAGAAASVTALTPVEAEKILAESTLSEEQPSLPFSDDVYGCTKPSRDCSLAHERKLIAASDAVKREGKRLTVAPASTAPAAFLDWTMPTTKTADGDEETHWYLGRLPGSGYHRVEVQFGHDAPGSFLINPTSGKVAFVHNGSDVVVPAQDGKYLLTFNTLNPPLSIRVAALDASGPNLQLQCEVGKDNNRVTGQFKGWHDARSFDLVLQLPAAHSKLMQAIAVRATLRDGAWSIAASEVDRLAAIGFVCHRAAASP